MWHVLIVSNNIFADGRALVPTQDKKDLGSYEFKKFQQKTSRSQGMEKRIEDHVKRLGSSIWYVR